MGSLRLTLLRHGQAQPIDSSPEDYERVLTRRGAIEAAEMAARLVHRGLTPDFIIASPAERTWATAVIVAGACEIDTKHVECARELYLASPEVIWRSLRRRHWPASHVLICGHNPGLSQVASRFGPTPKPRDLPTGGFAMAEFHHASWTTIEPEQALWCELDDPESMADLWA